MFLFASFVKTVEPHIYEGLKNMLRENGKRIWEKKHSLLHWHFFSFFESVMLSTYVHILKSTYILQSTNHEPLSRLYLGETEGLECTQSQS